MTTPRPPSLLTQLKDRGLIAQLTHDEALEAWLAQEPRTFYIGYDPTADSLHAGHLVTLMAARWLTRAGHRCLLLAGGGTARIGDPTGKSEMRPMASVETLNRNAHALHAQLQKLLPNEQQMQLVNNADWLSRVSLFDFLRDTAPHFSVARMLSAETYKARLGAGLSLLEFCYQPLQSLDYSVLCKEHDCRLQVGGDDQWSNILGGVELCRRRGQGQTYGLTVPLIATANGQKMGKTQGGAVWLDANKVTPASFYQYWVNTTDDDLVRFLKLFTLLPSEEIQDVASRPPQQINAAKNILAYEVTAWVHGPEEADKAHRAALASFGGRIIAADLLPTCPLAREVTTVATDMPSHALAAHSTTDVSALLVTVGFAKSNNEARRLITQGAVSIDGDKVTDLAMRLEAEKLASDGIVLRAGKKRIIRIVRKA